MKIIDLPEIQAAVSTAGAIEAVKAGFIAYGKGEVTLPTPMQILFYRDEATKSDLRADCHVKAAQSTSSSVFCLKLATGFYDNESQRGFPNNNGLMIVLSSETGEPLALLKDGGWLTDVRTGAAGALAAGLCRLDSLSVTEAVLGIVGTGVQAKRQAEMICQHVVGLKSVRVYGRNASKAAALCEALKHESGLLAEPVETVKALCEQCTIVVTTTPSTQPVIKAADLPADLDKRRLHIIAVGADSPGKVEIAPEVVAKATAIFTDDHDQCVDHSDFGAAVRAGAVKEDSDCAFCRQLERGPIDQDSGLSLVDLTGLGVQDLAMAQMVTQK